MKILLNFKCGSCQRKYEKYIDSDTQTIKCECGSNAARCLSAPKYFGNTVGKSPSLL